VSASTGASGNGPIVINSGRHEVFVPAPDNDTSTTGHGAWSTTQTAESAWAAFAALNQFATTDLPAEVTPALGKLTVPIGPVGPAGSMAYDAHDKTVWAYKWTWCQPGVADTNPDPSQCVHWLFLDGDTAIAIDETWQS
jgi:hypothetical protein